MIVTGDPQAAARALSRAFDAPVFALSERHGAWRVVGGAGRRAEVDVSPVTGGSIEADLRRRDFTVNAVALRLADGALVDVVEGVAAIHDRRLSVASAGAFRADPLRLVRLARFGAELGFAVDGPTVELARLGAAAVDEAAGERVALELQRILAADGRRGLELLDRTGVGQRLLPGRGAALAEAAPVVAALGAGREDSSLPVELQPELDRRLDEATDVRAALRLAALLVDADAAAAAAGRLRLSRPVRTVAVRTVGALARGAPPADPPGLLRWLQGARPAGLAALALAVAGDPSLADRAAPAVALLAPRVPLVTGDDLRRLLGLAPGPRLGALLQALEDEHALGRIATRDEALAAARRRLGERP